MYATFMSVKVCVYVCWIWCTWQYPGVRQDTALCGATLCPPEVKSCTNFVRCSKIAYSWKPWLGFKCFQRLPSVQFIGLHRRSFWRFYRAFYKDILHFLNPNIALEKKKIEQNGRFYSVSQGTVDVIIYMSMSVHILHMPVWCTPMWIFVSHLKSVPMFVIHISFCVGIHMTQRLKEKERERERGGGEVGNDANVC